MISPRLEAGSFRDREGRVFYRGERVYRALGPKAREAWTALAATRFFPRLVDAGKIVSTRQVDDPREALAGLPGPWVAALEHERIPFVSYPYEWSFGMLRDAALLQLELLEEALAEDLTLKDASAYNVQWRGVRPVFIDVASFEPWRKGDPWVGYLQFCRLFLYPLLLTAYRDVPFQPWLRGSIDGIAPEACAAVFSFRDLARPAVMTDVVLQAKLQPRSTQEGGALRQELRQAGFKKELIVRNVRRLRKVVSRLRWRRRRSEWADYGECSYEEPDRLRKERFVSEAVASRRWRLAWDLGANVGRFSRLAAAHSEEVVAFDADHLAIERLYQTLRAEGPDNVLPLVIDLADPSPPLGWRAAERRGLTARGRPDLVLCLALLHHLVIGANIPLPELLEWLAELGGHLVIELVSKDDPMVRRLLRNKDDTSHEYEPEVFERTLGEHFEILRRELLPAGSRTLYFARPLAG